jgi:adenylate cyclase, class 2
VKRVQTFFTTKTRNMEKLETEVKFYLSDVQSMHARICKLGARSQGRFFEKNLRLEDTDNTLRHKRSLLRLRRDNKTTLTFKSTPPGRNTQFKILKELEVEVNDFDTMARILEALGFYCDQIYEKWRETLVLKQTKFCMDSMPYGNFLEIEGREEDIKSFAIRLGLHWGKRILLNYLEIFDILKKKMDLDFNDVTFDNFKNRRLDLTAYLSLMEADSSVF